MLTIATDTDTFQVDVSPEMTVEDLKACFEADSHIPAASQALYYNSALLQDPKRTLASYGISNDDLIVAHQTRPAASTSSGSASSRQPGSVASGGGGGGMNRSGLPQTEEQAEQLRQQLLQNPQMMAQLRSTHPQIAQAVSSSPSEFFRLLRDQARSVSEAQRARQQAEMELASADEFDVDAQRKIEEAIRAERVMENLEHAMEYSPESFGRVTMLYVETQVNGIPVKAFVDSGAQATIMSPDCAERCGIMRLLDTRFAGIARGVGTAKILGRVHSAQIRLGDDLFLPCSFTIMEGRDVELLFGLDMLKRFQAVIDLSQNSLIVQNKRIRFLDEHELPAAARMEGEVDSEGNPIPEPSTSNSEGGIGIGAQENAQAVRNTANRENRPKPISNFPGSGQFLSSTSNSTSSSSAGVPGNGMSWNHPTTTTSQSTSSTSTSTNPSNSTQSQTTSQSQSQHSEESIKNLVDLGASNEQALALLDAAGGNVEVAASLLFQQ